MAEKNKVPSVYKQGIEIKSWLDNTGPIFLKDMKQYLKTDDYNKIFKAYQDAAGATSTERLKKFKEFESLLNTVIFDEAKKGMDKYNEWLQKNDKKSGFKTEKDREMFEVYDTALKFKKGMPTKEHNYERISLDHYVENNGQGYTPEDMKYLAGLYDLDWDNMNDRAEFNKALSKKIQQKKVHNIMHPSFFDDPYGAYANFMLPVATAYAENNIDNLQGDFAQSFNPVKAIKTLANNPGLGAAVGGDIATNIAMAGAGTEAKGIGKAAQTAYNYAMAPAIREGSHVLVGNKDAYRGALDFVFGGVGTNLATPKMINYIAVKPTASAWRWAEGKGATSKTMQQQVDEAAAKAMKTHNDMFKNGQITNLHVPGGKTVIEEEVQMFDNQLRPLYETVKDTDGTFKRIPKKQKVAHVLSESPDTMHPLYADKNGKLHSLTQEQIHDLKLGKKVKGLPKNLSIEDIIPYEEARFMTENMPLTRTGFGNKDSKLLKERQNQLNHDRLDKLEGYTGYTPLEYAISTGKPESRYAYADRKIKNLFGSGYGQGAQSYGMNALGKPEYGGKLATGTMNVVTGMVDPDQRWHYTYGGEEQDAMQGSSQNDLALYLLQYKKHLEEPEYYPEPEDPEGYSKKSVEKLKQGVKDVYGSKK